eukprot:348320-Pleurochrysis_carterae.AAC.1
MPQSQQGSAASGWSAGGECCGECCGECLSILADARRVARLGALRLHGGVDSRARARVELRQVDRAKRVVARVDADGASHQHRLGDLKQVDHAVHAASDGHGESDKDTRDDRGSRAHLDPRHENSCKDKEDERKPCHEEKVVTVCHQNVHRTLERAVRTLQRQSVPEDRSERADAQAIERERHGARAADEIGRR